MVGVFASGKGMLLTKTGGIGKGTEYGVASAFGLDAQGGVDVAIMDRFLVRAAGRYQRVKFKFQGDGLLTDRDQDGEQDVGGATDVFLGGYLTLGYLF
jgi:hypothetical protein